MPELLTKLPIHVALRLIRKQRCVSQQRLADLIGVERPTITRYESGDRTLSGKRLGVMAEILQVDPGLFYRLTTDSPELAELVPLHDMQDPITV